MEHNFEVELDEQIEFNIAHDEEKDTDSSHKLKVRLDKWLWAARFYKTRPLARAAVEKGRVYYNGQKAKPNKEINIGAKLCIIQSNMRRFVIVTGLSTRRRSAEEAKTLFEDFYPENIQEELFQQDYNHHHNPYRRQSAKKRNIIRYLRRAFVRGEQGESTSFEHQNQNLQESFEQDFETNLEPNLEPKESFFNDHHS